jgi:hypothetical protein
MAIPTQVAEGVRASGASPAPYRHPAHSEVAMGHGPCRHCLRTFDIGAERRILFTYDAFARRETLPLPGPVVIHAEPCERYPEDTGFPDDLRAHALTLTAYANGRVMRAEEYVSDGRVEPLLGRLLARADVDYVHVRDTEAGCFDFLVERADEDSLTAAPGEHLR